LAHHRRSPERLPIASGPPPLRALGALLFALLVFASADLALAQFDQYMEPGGPTAGPEDRKGQLEKAMEDARWRLGVVRVKPWFGVYDVRYVDNAFGSPTGEEVSDVTGTVGAGLRAYLHSGPKVIWAAHALPEYVGWQELDERRSVNGRYGLGFFGFFNRLTVEAVGERDKQQRLGSPEVPEPVHQRSERARLWLELQATGAISVFTSGEVARLRSVLESPEEAPLDRLDRDATYLRGGLRWRLPRGWSVGLAAERSEVEFEGVDPAFDRSNSGTAPLLLVWLDREDHYLRFEAARRELEPAPGSSFPAFDEATGGLELGFGLESRLSTWIYGRRALVYSLENAYGYALDDRAGVSARLEVGGRSDLAAFAEAGKMDFVATSPAAADRRDDVRAIGASFGVGLGRSLSLTLLARRLEFESSVPGFDRGVTSFGVGVSLGGKRSEW
jgi:hypothetical protein